MIVSPCACMLLRSRLGQPQRRPLTQAQFWFVLQRSELTGIGTDTELCAPACLSAMGLSAELSARICELMSDGELLRAYLNHGRKNACLPLTVADTAFPHQLSARLGNEVPAVLWMKGNAEILPQRGVALVGSRELHPGNRSFAQLVGRRAAEQGFALISGNARGADMAAQEACLAAGGNVISVVADDLSRHQDHEHILYISEDGWDEPFSRLRALHRNFVIHAMGSITFAAQCHLGKGGTWDGSNHNLQKSWTPLLCFRDGSEGSEALAQRGAALIGMEELDDFFSLTASQMCLY